MRKGGDRKGGVGDAVAGVMSGSRAIVRRLLAGLPGEAAGWRFAVQLAASRTHLRRQFSSQHWGAVFPRSMRRGPLPMAVRGDGCFLEDADGTHYGVWACTGPLLRHHATPSAMAPLPWRIGHGASAIDCPTGPVAHSCCMLLWCMLLCPDAFPYLPTTASVLAP